jgi:hypothetical protein
MTKTTLTVDVEYDDQITDPESIASAADRLLETALSTPGIMEEYGDPRFEEFYVAKPSTNRPTVIVDISGGVLQDAFADGDVTLVLADWDCEGSEPSVEDDIFVAAGQPVRVVVLPVRQIAEIAGTETAKALEAAGMDVFQPQDRAVVEERRWVLYDHDADCLIGTKVFHSYDEALENLDDRLTNVVPLPIVLPTVIELN